MSRQLTDAKAELVRCQKVLAEFVRDIDDTGGVKRDRKGYNVPVADEDWVDLGETYVNACAVLGRDPKRREDDEVEVEVEVDDES